VCPYEMWVFFLIEIGLEWIYYVHCPWGYISSNPLLGFIGLTPE
jgi:hypothetical protein